MAALVRISRKTALRLLDFVAANDDWAVEELRTALKPKRFVQLARKRRVAKRATKNQETAAIRMVVMARSGGFCEACGFAPEAFGLPLEMDHFYGRVRVRQSADTVWMLCSPCHRRKTANTPSADYWRAKFARHLELTSKAALR